LDRSPFRPGAAAREKEKDSMIASLSAAASAMPWGTIAHVVGAMIYAGIGAVLGV
jgi:hypothetical protein